MLITDVTIRKRRENSDINMECLLPFSGAHYRALFPRTARLYGIIWYDWFPRLHVDQKRDASGHIWVTGLVPLAVSYWRQADIHACDDVELDLLRDKILPGVVKFSCRQLKTIQIIKKKKKKKKKKKTNNNSHNNNNNNNITFVLPSAI